MRWRSWSWLAAGLFLAALWCREWYAQAPVEPDRPKESSVVPEHDEKNPPQSSGQISPTAFPFRVSNTSRSVSSLVGNNRAILLENAVIATDEPMLVSIPNSLRAKADPLAYIVQAKDRLDTRFRQTLARSGARVVSYIPNNSFLVRADAATAAVLRADASVQGVLPYEPYYKVKPGLLAVLSNGSGLRSAPGRNESELIDLDVLLFPETAPGWEAELKGLNAQVLHRCSSVYGPITTIRCSVSSVMTLAGLPETQCLQMRVMPKSAMDLGRAAAGVSPTAVAEANYLNLSGAGAKVTILDTGIDASHAALVGRVFLTDAGSGMDPSGHGTHIAGIIAGDGAGSGTVANAPGSPSPIANRQFRGVAPGAKLFSVSLGPELGAKALAAALQIACTNGTILNASWNFSGDADYDLAAVLCDAAARDASPGTPGSQPVLSVFSAGNEGHAQTDGSGGVSGSIQSPGTAKNGITVGALEKRRLIADETWSCTGPGSCVTNRPWLSSTDSSNQVARFSSRGNVGAGIEGLLGRCKPDLVAQGTFVIAPRSTQWDQIGYYQSLSPIFTAVPDANYAGVLSNLNNGLGPLYRFESGTSMAAAQVSGALCLVKEFFARLGHSISPAGAKALLINGARPNGSEGFGPSARTNAQGWGQLSLPNSLHSTLTNLTAVGTSMLFFDQDSSTALCTGESLTRCIEVRPAARSQPLRVTLVWTDPPGNPAAAVKLVNNLDLVLTNLDTGEVYSGNDFAPGELFSRPCAGSGRTHDLVNNVESVLLNGPVAGRYSVTVIGQQVNVNTLSSNADRVAQDYALVISSGDGEVPDALAIDLGSSGIEPTPKITIVTNQFSTEFGAAGGVFWHDRVGSGIPAMSTNSVPLDAGGTAFMDPGTTNQWHFYVVTNDTPYSYAAFLTFLPKRLSAGSPVPGADQADIDLYVSTDPGLLSLDPGALAQAVRSVGRGGTETIVLSNVTSGVLYAGVKCESRGGAEYGFMAFVSELPFAEQDAQGRMVLRGFPAMAPIPAEGSAAIVGIAPDPLMTRRVLVTNSVLHPAPAQLLGELHHQGTSVVLDHFSDNAGPSYVYDDSGEAPWMRAHSSDGPGSLRDYGGGDGYGQWLLEMQSTNAPGTNELFSVALEPQPDLATGMSVSIEPGACRSDFIRVPPGVNNLAAEVSFTGGDGPVQFQLLPNGSQPADLPELTLEAGEVGVLKAELSTAPPIRAGLYELRVCNRGQDLADVTLRTTMADPQPRPTFVWEAVPHAELPDEAVITSQILVTNLERVESAQVSVRIDHPRISDLVLHLVSPEGTRILLQENRGGASVDGLGTDTLLTNTSAIVYTGGAEAFTNIFETGQTQGIASIDYDLYRAPDTMHVYYEDTLLFDTGLASWAGRTNLAYGPGTDTSLMIVMNEGGNADTNTAWEYRVTTTRQAPVPVTFTENTNLASVPVKFAPFPLTNVLFSVPGLPGGFGIFYLPEQSLDRLAGEPAVGPWKLEIEDTAGGPSNAVPRLVSWRLELCLQPTFPAPVTIERGRTHSAVLAPRQELWFVVDVPEWASFATNRLLSASGPVDLLFASIEPLRGTNSAALLLAQNQTTATAVFQTNGSPELVRSARYFLGLRNTNSATAAFSLRVDFDVNEVQVLENGVPIHALNAGPEQALDYYSFLVSSDAVRAQFEVNNPTENLTLYASRGMPLPGPGLADYWSANPWTNDELIVVHDYSQPVQLSQGRWYLSVLNPTARAASYTILATEWTAHGTNLVIGDTTIDSENVCLTWNSLPGVHYFVQAKADLQESEWQTVSPTVTAAGGATSFCVPLSLGFQYFRISEGLVLSEPPLAINLVSISPTGALLEWMAEPGRRFVVQWSSNATTDAVAWSEFTNVINSSDGVFRFLDDGTQSGGLGTIRFYRVRQVR